MQEFEVATSVAAWFGALGALGSMVWAIATWRKARNHVRVNATLAYLVFSENEISPPVLSVTVVNTGQDPITVNGWGVTTRDGNLIAFVSHPHSASLPTKLGTNDSATYYSDLDPYAQEQERSGWPWKKMRPFVNLTTGSVKGRKGIPRLVPKGS